MNKSPKPIKVSQQFSNTTDQVWEAITEKERMTQWFFDTIPKFEPREGFYTEFSVFSGKKEFIHRWKIVEVIPKRKIVYDWSYENYPGKGIVTFELFELEGGCVLELTNEGIESFPKDIPEFKRESCINGWRYFIKDRLVEYLDINS